MTAHEKLIRRIRSKTLNTLAISPEGRNTLTKSVLKYRGQEIPDSHRRLAKLATTFTIGDAMDAAEKQGYASGYLHGTLADLGMTYLDWALLRPETATDRIGILKKHQLLGLDVRVLQAFSYKALHQISHYVLGQARIEAGDIPRITIAELIAKVTLPGISNQHFGSFETSYRKARKFLGDLGFGYNDGPFFQEGTSRKLAEDLAAKHRISRRRAYNIIEIACDEGWINPPLG